MEEDVDFVFVVMGLLATVANTEGKERNMHLYN